MYCFAEFTMLVSFMTFFSDAYDPMDVSGEVTIHTEEFDYGNQGRKVPLTIYVSEVKLPAPVILFSHGLGGSRNNNEYLGRHWAGRGYAVVVMQHAGSDEAIWKNARPRQRMTALKNAANGQSLRNRIADVSATLDQLQAWNEDGQKFGNRFDINKVGMSGHSFGAVTTQAVSGQSYGRRGQTNTDKRIKAAVAFSPSVPVLSNNSQTFANVDIPWLLMTGTKDSSAIGRTTASARRKVFHGLPDGGKFYELVLHEAEHMAFSDRTLLGGQHRNPNHHKAIKAISSAFWDAYLRDDEAALKWLQGSGPVGVLESQDEWQKK